MSSWIERDPKAAEEAEKYGNPVPSREFLLQFMNELGRPVTHPQLCEELGIEDEECVNAVSFRLKAMCRDGQLMSNRRNQFAVINRMDLIAGRVLGHRDGYGFVRPDAGGDDLFLSARQMSKVFDGDRVLVHEEGRDFKGRREGKIVEVLERCTKKVVGRFSGHNGVGYLNPENQKITQKIMIVRDDDSTMEYQDEQLVVAEIITQPGKRQMPQAKVIEVLGDHLAPGMEIKVAIHNYDIPNEWPSDVRQQVGELSAEVEESAKQNRIDLRDLPLVTIDGEDARDFDDAVYAERKKGGGWRLWVAIADVSHYVRPGSPLDQEGLQRGNSVYFPEFVVPMLPELLSNGLCSLNPHVDRLAMVCEMTISAAGNLSGYKFYEAVIQSHARLTYTKVGHMLMSPGSKEGKQLRDEYSSIVPHLETLHELYHQLRDAREERGAIDFDTTETRILFSDQRKIEKIVPVQRNDAHKVIEECMLAANVATARLLQKLKKNALYRVHEGPKEQKIENLRSYLGELGLNLGGGDDPQPKDYLQLSEWIDGRPDQHIIQIMMLRSMSQAVYTPDNNGHFGLAYKAYTHFTSPIRRYPDLLVHRIIRGAIHAGVEDRSLDRVEGFVANPDYVIDYSMEQVLQLGEHCSMTERRADDATRDVMAWLKCEYMTDQIGEEFTGNIAAVTGFGLFVELDDVYVEGLIHVTALPGDYYHFEQAKQRLVGERTRKSFKLGDRLKVKVVRVDLDERKIDFELVEVVGHRRTRAKTKRQLLAEGKLRAPSEQKTVRKRKTSENSSATPAARKGKGRVRVDDLDESLSDARKAKKHKKRGGAKKAGSGKKNLSRAEKEVQGIAPAAKGKSKKALKRKSRKSKAGANGKAKVKKGS